MGIVYFAAIRDEQMRLCAADIMPLRGAGANAFFSRKKKALDQKSCANLQLDRLPALKTATDLGGFLSRHRRAL